MKAFRLLLLLSAALAACTATRQGSTAAPDAMLQFYQINDVYEIAPVQGGAAGGMARVATQIKALKAAHPATYSVIAGDFYSPSVIGTCKWEGKRIYGAHMVDVLNVAGMDLATFGNHEFDIPEGDVLARLRESEFAYVSANVLYQTGGGRVPFRSGQAQEAVLPYKIISVPGAGGKTWQVGVIGVTLPFNQQPYVWYDDMYASVKRVYDQIEPETDAVVAITHLNIEEDRELARRVPGLTLIMGGHEHELHSEKVGRVFIAKADANARTAWVHQLKFSEKGVTLSSEVKQVNAGTPEDPATAEVVKKWETRAYQGFIDQGFDLYKPVATFDTPLDGLEAHIRTQPTNLGTLIAQSMSEVAGTPVAVVNSGSVRIDDYLSGEIREFDLIRALPFGGSVQVVEMKGRLLIQTLETGLSNTGKGGYLQTFGVEKTATGWNAGGAAIDPAKTYAVAISDFLMTGREANLGFLTPENPDVVKVTLAAKESPLTDIRKTVIAYLRK